jgi:hypothetical protein
MKNQFEADYVDTITEPGADKAITEGELWQVDSIKSRLTISVNSHGSNAVAIVGHHGCAGNPVDKAAHLEMTKRAVDVVASWGFPVRIIGLWVGENWEIEKICEKTAG